MPRIVTNPRFSNKGLTAEELVKKYNLDPESASTGLTAVKNLWEGNPDLETLEGIADDGLGLDEPQLKDLFAKVVWGDPNYAWGKPNPNKMSDEFRADFDNYLGGADKDMKHLLSFVTTDADLPYLYGSDSMISSTKQMSPKSKAEMSPKEAALYLSRTLAPADTETPEMMDSVANAISSWRAAYDNPSSPEALQAIKKLADSTDELLDDDSTAGKILLSRATDDIVKALAANGDPEQIYGMSSNWGDTVSKLVHAKKLNLPELKKALKNSRESSKLSQTQKNILAGLQEDL